MRRIDVSPQSAPHSAELSALVRELREQANAFIFLSGGASGMRAEDEEQLLAMFAALADLARSGLRFAVGDGGTQAGIMKAAGEARQASGGAFPLIGVAPAKEIPPRGKTEIEPNHTAIIAVDDPAWPPDQDGWGSETSTMYDVFDRLSVGRPSVAVVANGGGITLAEVEENVKAGRTIILVEGSGRAADAIASLLKAPDKSGAYARGSAPDKSGAYARGHARGHARGYARGFGRDATRLVRRPDLYRIVRLEAGRAGLRAALHEALGRHD